MWNPIRIDHERDTGYVHMQLLCNVKQLCLIRTRIYILTYDNIIIP